MVKVSFFSDFIIDDELYENETNSIQQINILIIVSFGY